MTSSGCVKNQEGKNYGKTSGEKLPVVRPITTNLIPDVEGFTVIDIGCWEPFVVVWWITEPADEELPATPSGGSQ